jgi:predicted MFS family arabinose efflux permease
VLRRLVGGDAPEAVRPLVLVQLLRSTAGSSMFVFAGLWALRRLHATPAELSVAFAVLAVIAVIAGYAGGRLSDLIGRRIPILIGASTNMLAPLAAIAVGSNKYAGFATIAVLWAVSSIGDAADGAIVADLTAPEDREQGYATLRVASNSGTIIGPALGGLLLAIGWDAMFAGSAAVGTAAVIVAVRRIPDVHGAARAADAHAPLRVILADHRFLVLIAAFTASWTVYLAFEYLMPISLVQNHGLQPNVWGFLLIANPIAVTLLQLRVTRAASRISLLGRLVLGLALMGPPFLLLGVNDSVPMIILIVVVFVFGEMLIVPAGMAAVAAAAPEDLRGTYMGAAGAAPAAAFALTPLLGLQMLGRYGDQAMWLLIACIAGVGAVLFVVALGGRQERRSITTA